MIIVSVEQVCCLKFLWKMLYYFSILFDALQVQKNSVYLKTTL